MLGDWRGLYTIGTRRADRMRGSMANTQFHVPLHGRGGLLHLPTHLGMRGGMVNAVSIARDDRGHLLDIPATSQTPPLLSLSPPPSSQHSPRRRIPSDTEGSALPEISCQSSNEVANSE